MMTDEQRSIRGRGDPAAGHPDAGVDLTASEDQTAFPGDFHWFSPVLTEQLAGNRRTRWFAHATKRSCASWSPPARSIQLPLTLQRQRHRQPWPTGPLEGGLLVDMTGLQPDRRPRQRHGTRPSRHSSWQTSKPPPAQRMGAALHAVDLPPGEPGRPLTAAGSAASAPSTMGHGCARQCASASSNDRRAGPRVLTAPAPALLLHHAYGTNRHYPRG